MKNKAIDCPKCGRVNGGWQFPSGILHTCGRCDATPPATEAPTVTAVTFVPTAGGPRPTLEDAGGSISNLGPLDMHWRSLNEPQPAAPTASGEAGELREAYFDAVNRVAHREGLPEEGAAIAEYVVYLEKQIAAKNANIESTFQHAGNLSQQLIEAERAAAVARQHAARLEEQNEALAVRYEDFKARCRSLDAELRQARQQLAEAGAGEMWSFTKDTQPWHDDATAEYHGPYWLAYADGEVTGENYYGLNKFSEWNWNSEKHDDPKIVAYKPQYIPNPPPAPAQTPPHAAAEAGEQASNQPAQ